MPRFLLPYEKAKIHLQDDEPERTLRILASETGFPLHNVRPMTLTSTGNHHLFLFAAATSSVVHSERFLK